MGIKTKNSWTVLYKLQPTNTDNKPVIKYYSLAMNVGKRAGIDIQRGVSDFTLNP